MEKHYIKVGTITLNDTCDVTDPCYNKDVWCRTTVKNMKPGIYECHAALSDEDDWGIRVAETRILHENFRPDGRTVWERVGDIGVDAGLAGFFDNKPDFTDEQWHDFCNGMNKGGCYETAAKDAYLGKFDGRDGFWTHSGYGDGCYDLFAAEKDGKIVGLWLIFIDDEDDDYEEGE